MSVVPRVSVPVCVVESVVPRVSVPVCVVKSVVLVCVVSRCVYTSVLKRVLRCTHAGSKRACVRAPPCLDETPCETPCVRTPCVPEPSCVTTMCSSALFIVHRSFPIPYFGDA